ncbi:MAG: FkbM family methyltransferase [Bacteroidetes bacterium]|nr:FkbM family methyltransferase [Bacteroidota bacterium]
MHRIKYWQIRFYVTLFVLVKNIFRNYWHVVRGIYLPLTRDIGFNTLRWIINGQYEQGEIEIIRQRIDPGDRVMEIGTGLGFVSAYCAKIVGSDHVYTFEANPLNVEMALRVHAKNNVAPHLQNALLADRRGIIDFPINRKSRLSSSLLKSSCEIVKVPQLNLNETIEALSPDFLIMDIEGAEYEIFRMIRFQSIKKIQVELHPSILGKVRMNEIFDVLKENQFVTDIAMPDGRNYFFKRVQA